jgi:hypothetical protein
MTTSRRCVFLVALLAVASCAQNKAAPPPAAPVKQDDGQIPLALEPHFVCGPERMRRNEAEEASNRANRSINDVKASRGDRDPSLGRLEEDLATARTNYNEADKALSDCEARVENLRRERIALAGSRPVREIRVFPEEERLDREKARVKEDDERLRAAYKSDPARFMAPIVSALSCATLEARQFVADELAKAQATKKKDKKLKERIAELQAKVKQGDGLLDGLNQELAKAGSKAVDCGDATIGGLRDCLVARSQGHKSQACDDSKLDDPILAWDAFELGAKMKDRWTFGL